MVEDLRNLTHHTPAPLRRVYIPKPGKKEMRGLSIPTMLDRALQALVKLALEPEWEARFEPNSCGFRPGRSSHDAIESVFNFTRLKPKYVLDADITKCFDKISHDAILDKLHTIRPIERLARGWLKAGIVDHGETIFPEAGAAQGGPLSPLLANVALHGLETVLRQAAPAKSPPGVIRYADDFGCFTTTLTPSTISKPWQQNGWQRSACNSTPKRPSSPTPSNHTMGKSALTSDGTSAWAFHVRQYPMGKHRTRTYRGKPGYKTFIEPSRKALQRQRDKLRDIIQHHRGAPQAGLVYVLNPVIQGWANYYQYCVAKRDFQILDNTLYHQLTRWARQPPPTQERQVVLSPLLAQGERASALRRW
jgi:RNA-directed DNA polymerase